MNCSWRSCLCFLAAEQAPFCLFVGKTWQGWRFLPVPLGAGVGWQEMWEHSPGAAVSWSWCVQGRLSLVCRAPDCRAGPGLGLLGGFGEASSRAQQGSAPGGGSWAEGCSGAGYHKLPPSAENRLETTCEHLLSSDRLLMFCLWTGDLWFFGFFSSADVHL